MEQRNCFVDLEKEKLEILEEKIVSGIIEFEMDPRKQWTELRLEKPLLNKLLNLVQEEYRKK